MERIEYEGRVYDVPADVETAGRDAIAAWFAAQLAAATSIEGALPAASNDDQE